MAHSVPGAIGVVAVDAIPEKPAARPCHPPEGRAARDVPCHWTSYPGKRLPLEPTHCRRAGSGGHDRIKAPKDIGLVAISMVVVHPLLAIHQIAEAIGAVCFQ